MFQSKRHDHDSVVTSLVFARSLLGVLSFLPVFLPVFFVQTLLLCGHIVKQSLSLLFLPVLLLEEADILMLGTEPGDAHVARMSGGVQRCSRELDQSARAVVQTLHRLLVPAVVVHTVPSCRRRQPISARARENATTIYPDTWTQSMLVYSLLTHYESLAIRTGAEVSLAFVPNLVPLSSQLHGRVVERLVSLGAGGVRAIIATTITDHENAKPSLTQRQCVQGGCSRESSTAQRTRLSNTQALRLGVGLASAGQLWQPSLHLP